MIKQAADFLMKRILPYNLYSDLIYIKKSYSLFRQKNSKSVALKNMPKAIIYFADGSMPHGGLADRLRGMISLYSIAKKLKVDYKIHMTSPVPLTTYLLPNQHNWEIKDEQISYNLKHSIIYQIWYDKNKTSEFLRKEALTTCKRLFKKWRQLLIISNSNFADFEYGALFNELFTPTQKLNIELNKHRKNLKGPYIAVTFRFQQLLGDFKEADYPTLNPNDQLLLIEKCKLQLQQIRNQNKNKKLLVTSDSVKFLEAANTFNYTYIVPGKIAHIDYDLNKESDVYLKSFVDYFLISEAEKVILVIEGEMYNSGFPKRAALHNNKEFIIHK